MFDAVLNISSSTFDDNRMSFESNGIIGMRSDITSSSNTFVNHRCDTGCYFYLFQSSTMTDTGSHFSKSENTGGAGGVLKILTQSQATFTGTTIQDCSGSGAIVAQALDVSTIIFNNVKMTEIKHKDAFGQELAKTNAWIEANSSYIEITGCTFSKALLRIIYADDAYSIKIKTTTVSEVDTYYDGAFLYALSADSVEIEDSTFVDNSALTAKGGVLFFDGNSNGYTVKNSNFTDNSAGYGGAIYALETLTVNGTHFENNKAIEFPDEDNNNQPKAGDGGAIYFSCAECTGIIAGNTFNHNSASVEGGAIKVNNNYPTLSKNTFTNNSAEYGVETAYYPIKLS